MGETSSFDVQPSKICITGIDSSFRRPNAIEFLLRKYLFGFFKRPNAIELFFCKSLFDSFKCPNVIELFLCKYLFGFFRRPNAIELFLCKSLTEKFYFIWPKYYYCYKVPSNVLNSNSYTGRNK